MRTCVQAWDFNELNAFLNSGEFAGAQIPFEYRILGRGLVGSIYPAQIRLFRKNQVRIVQPGHSQAFEVNGSVCKFRSRLIHEDLKPLNQWLTNQMKYASLEAIRIRRAGKQSLKDWIRIAGISPMIVGAWAYISAGGPFLPVVSRAYAYERLMFEAILARILTETSEELSSRDVGCVE